MSVTTTGGHGPLVPHDMNGAMQLAAMMAKGKLVPQHLRESPGDCLMVIEQAMRWNMSPFAVAQCTSVIQGKLMFEGKLVSAALHTSGIMEQRLREEFGGSGDTRHVTLTGTIRGETKPRVITVTLKEAKTSNGMWTKQPDQQLIYFATRAWARRHAPEVMLGVYSPEEFDQPRDNFAGTTVEGLAIRPDPEQVMQPTEPPKKTTAADWLKALDTDLANAKTADEVDAVIARQDVQDALDHWPQAGKDRLQHMIDAAIKRTAAPVSDDVAQWENEEDTGGAPVEAEPDMLEKMAQGVITELMHCHGANIGKYVAQKGYKDFVARLQAENRKDLMIKVRDAATQAATREPVA